MVGLIPIDNRSWTSKAATVLLLLCESTSSRSYAQRTGPGASGRSIRNPTNVKGGDRLYRELAGKTSTSDDCRDEDGKRITCAPTQSPTISPAPSAAPSPPPTASPTTPAPSSTPSIQPSGAPSLVPSPAPSPSPSLSPAPSASPSAAPSPLPSSSPSYAPSVSFAPTESIFSKVQDAEGFQMSECTNLNQFDFVSSSTEVSSFVPFDYLIYLNETLDQTSVQDIVDDLEPKIHISLAREVMTCDILDTFSLVRLSSAGEDVVNGLCNNQPSDPAEGTCWKVNANITTTFFFVTARRQRSLNDIEVVGPLAGWLTSVFSQLAEEEDDIYNLELDGFQALEALGGQEFAETQQDIGTGENQALSGNIPLATDGTDNIGFFVLVGIAGFALVVVLLVVVVRRNKRRRELLKHVNEVEDLSLDESIKEDLRIKSGVYDVDRDEAEDRAGPPIEVFEGVEVEDANHDYRTCASPTCYICKSSLRRPVFISTDMGGQRADRKLHTQQGKQVPDTQVL